MRSQSEQPIYAAAFRRRLDAVCCLTSTGGSGGRCRRRREVKPLVRASSAQTPQHYLFFDGTSNTQSSATSRVSNLSLSRISSLFLDHEKRDSQRNAVCHSIVFFLYLGDYSFSQAYNAPPQIQRSNHLLGHPYRIWGVNSTIGVDATNKVSRRATCRYAH